MKKVICILLFMILINSISISVFATDSESSLTTEVIMDCLENAQEPYKAAQDEEEKKIEEAEKALDSLLSKIESENTESKDEVEETKKTKNIKDKKGNSTSTKINGKVNTDKNIEDVVEENKTKNIVVSNNVVLEESNVIDNKDNTLQNTINQILEVENKNNSNLLEFNNVLIYLICVIVIVIIILIIVACKKVKNKANKG